MIALVIATSNENKLREIVFEVKDIGIRVYTLKDFSPLGDCPETGKTFLDNARQKAEYYFQLLQQPVLAEDSGIVLSGLEGFPGIHSARVAPDDSSRIRLVLERLANGIDRSASYICSMVLRMTENTYEAEADCRGVIVESPLGDGGFGYDPIFCPEGSNRTFGQMSLEEKSVYSHRGKAVRKILPYLLQELAAAGNRS